MTDGPYAETKEQLGGIQVLEARDLNHAIHLISQSPGVKLNCGTIEIRPAADVNEIMRERAATAKGHLAMSAATRERMISSMALVLVISTGFLMPKAAVQSDKYSKIATVDQYLMDRNAEILLARSAAPDSISSDATILVLGDKAMKQLSEERTGLSVWWKEDGWRCLTCLSSGTRRGKVPNV